MLEQDLDDGFRLLTRITAEQIERDHRAELGELAHLQPAVRAAVPAAIPGASCCSPQVSVVGWGARLPGSADFAVRVDPSHTIYGECKVDKLGETLWDLIKLCSIPGARKSYMMVAAWRDYWRRKPLAPLYVLGAGPRDVSFADAIARWPEAWEDLLIGGRGIRPVEIPARARIEALAGHQVAAYPDWRLRCISVAPLGDERLRFADDGWPLP
jgi:hypothetical protein